MAVTIIIGLNAAHNAFICNTSLPTATLVTLQNLPQADCDFTAAASAAATLAASAAATSLAVLSASVFSALAKFFCAIASLSRAAIASLYVCACRLAF